MIRHIVLTRLKPDVQETAIAAVYAGLSAVVACHPRRAQFLRWALCQPRTDGTRLRARVYHRF